MAEGGLIASFKELPVLRSEDTSTTPEAGGNGGSCSPEAGKTQSHSEPKPANHSSSSSHANVKGSPPNKSPSHAARHTLGNAPEHKAVSPSAHGAPSAHIAHPTASPVHAHALEASAVRTTSDHAKIDKEKAPPATPERKTGVAGTHSPSHATSTHSPSHITSTSSASKAVSSVASVHAVSTKGESYECPA